jgi:hypothetical protein
MGEATLTGYKACYYVSNACQYYHYVFVCVSCIHVGTVLGKWCVMEGKH